MDDELKSLANEVGTLLEDLGRTLKCDSPYSHENLTDLRDACNHCAETIQTVRDMMYPE